MNHVYRIVWNHAVRAWVAVAETARGRGKSSRSARPAAVALAAVLGAGLVHAQAVPSVVVAPGAQTNAYVSGNGVTVVNIANPNGAGLSHNRYQQFNVNASGLVLNNTTTQQVTYSSQLAGQIMANYNMANTASVILNEVVSNNRSTLAGFTEVLGRKADVVLANPYGITCSSCGFINTDRVTLTTGLPFMRADGSLGGFNVSQGDILVTGNGLNATAQQVLDLVTRSVRIEGPINAQDLSITTGTNAWDYGTRAVTGSVEAQGSAPTYAIDSSALGGMYANRIRLTATEAGVGVRMLGDAAASAEDFTLTAAGRVELNNRISAQRDVRIASTSNDAAAIALADASLTAARDVAAVATQGGMALVRSAVIAGNDLKASGTRLDAGQGSRLQAGAALDASASAGDLALGAAAVRAQGDLRLASAGKVSIASGDGQGVQSLAGDLSIQAAGGLDNAGVITADQGSTTVRAGSLISNSGTVNAGRNLDIADASGGATQALVNSGALLSGEAMSTHAAAIDNSGWMQAGTRNTIDAASLNNTGHVLAVTGDAALDVTGTLDNSGSLRAAQDIVAKAGRLDNSGDVLAARAIDLQGGTIANRAAGWVQAAAGSTVRADSLTNEGTWLLSQQAGSADRVDVAGSLVNTGVMQSAGSASIGAGDLDNRQVIATAGDLAIATTGALKNASNAVLQAGQALSLDGGGAIGNAAGGIVAGATVALNGAQGLDNDGVITAEAGDATLRVDGTLANTGRIHAASTLDIADRSGGATQALDNSGQLLADGALALRAGAVQNQAAGWVQAANGSSIDAASLDNQGVWLLSTQPGGSASQVRVAGTLTNSGTLQAQQDAVLTASRIDNQALALLRTGGNLTANVSAANGLSNAGTMQAGTGQSGTGATLAINGAGSQVDNAGTGVMLGDKLAIAVGSLTNAGNIQGGGAADSSIAATGTVTNQAGGVITMAATAAGGGTLSGQRIVNQGTLQSLGGMTLGIGSGGLQSTVDGTPGNGDILANGALTLQALGGNSYAATIDGTLQSGGELKVTGNGQSSLAINANALGDTVTVDTGDVTIGALSGLISQKDLNLKASTLSLGVQGSGSTAKTGHILAALGGTGSGTVALTQALTNNGLIFSATDLSVTAPSITVSGTGALSALNTLNVRANGGALDLSAATPSASAGNLSNAGLLYAGSQLNATANGTLTNTGDINSEGSLSLTANTLVNGRIINATDDVRIVAATLRNEIIGLTRNDVRGADSEHVEIDSRDDKVSPGVYDGGNKDVATLYEYRYTVTQEYSQALPSVVPQITAGRDMLLAFHEGRNTGGTIFAGTSMTLQGFSYDAAQADKTAHADLGIADGVHGFRLDGATFTNDNLALTTTEHVVRYSLTTKYIALGPEKKYENSLCERGGTWDDVCYTSGYEDTPQTPSANNVLRAGLYTSKLTGSGFSLYNNGATARTVGANENLIAIAEAASTTKTTPKKGGPQTGIATTGTQDLSSAEGPKGPATYGGTAAVNPLTGISFLDANAANGVKGTSFGGINIALPTNPNGLFVTVREPGAKYLVETNPLYLSGSATMGSDYLSKLLGYNPDELSMRLGDASYEAWLVKQQLIVQTGSAVLASYQGADTQMKGLMESAAGQAQSLGLVYGKALTPEQQAALKQDMVWMVQTEIDGKTVLAPVVYLAQSTKNNIASGAVISAQDANLSLTSLTNTGGTIVGGKSLVVTSAGDITNLSGTIKGGNVSLSSTDGSIVNKTDSQSGGGDHFYSTVLGKTAGIESTGTLSLDAKKDITNIGATMNAGTDASLKAGGNVTFDTIEKKDTSSTYSNLDVKNGNGYTSTTTTTVQQVKSGLTVGGNLAVDAGKDITLAGTDAKVGGNADLKAGGDLNIVARENSTTTHTETKSSGLGMNNSLYGSNSTTTDSLSVRNVGSGLQVGGDASFTAGKDMTVQGSNIDVKGNGQINATNLNVLAGRDYDETHTTTKSTGVMQVSASAKGSASADASADSSSGRGRASASAEASAGATGTGAAGLAFSSTTTTTTDTTDLRHVGSNLNFGGDLTVNASKDVTLQGSTVNAGGNATVNAQNVNLLAAEDKKTSTTTTTSTSVGLMASTDNKAEAGASAGAQAAGGKGTPGAGAQAGAQASAESENHLDLVQHTTSTTSTLDTTHQGSAINAGGNLNVNASNNLTLEGSSMKSGGDMNLNATDMTFKAVNDVHEVSTSSSTTTAGLYATGKADASANASAQAGLGAQAGAKGEASASIEVGLYGSNTTSSSVDGSTKAVTSSLSSGGNINRTATNSINDQGTQIEGAGNLNQSAKTITSTAAADTTYSSSNSTTHTAKVGAYAEASVGASADASVGPGASKPGGSETNAGAGIRASYQYDNASEQSNSSTAVVSTIKMGGSVNSTSSGTTTLEGTQISAGKDVSLEASSLDYKAAQNTSSSSSKSTSAGGSVSVDLVKKEASVGVNYDGSNSSSSSSTAVVGGIQAGGNLSVKTSGDTRLEGTNLSAGGAASIDAGGKVDFAAAKNTASSSSQQVGVDVGVTAGKSGGSGSAGVGYSESKSSLNEDVAGSIKSGSGPLTIKSGGDANFTGTQISSQQGDVSVSAGGALNFNAAHKMESSSSVGVDVSASASAGKKENVGGTRNATTGKKTGGETMDERSGSASLGVGTSKSNSDTATGGGITSGGAIKLSSGGNTTLEGTQVKAANGVSAEAGGSFVQKEAKSTSSSQTVGFSASASGSTRTPEKKKTGASSPAPAPSTAAPSPSPAPSPSTKSSGSPSPAPAPKPSGTTTATTTSGKTGASNPPSVPPPPTPSTAPASAPAAPAAAPATTAAKPPVSPNQQQKGSGIVDVYVDNQKSSSSQATTIDGGAGGVVIKQGTAGK